MKATAALKAAVFTWKAKLKNKILLLPLLLLLLINIIIITALSAVLLSVPLLAGMTTPERAFAG